MPLAETACVMGVSEFLCGDNPIAPFFLGAIVSVISRFQQALDTLPAVGEHRDTDRLRYGPK